MKSTSKLKLIKSINKILKIKSEKYLLKVKRNKLDTWDSLAHLQIIFLLEKNIKKKISIEKINKISDGKQLIRIISDN